MPRIACIFVPDFPLAALLRTEAELVGRPVVVHERDEPHAPLTAVSIEARTLGARPGLSTAQSRMIAGGLVVRCPRPQMLRSAEEALVDVAESFSPRVESVGGGVVFLEIDGLSSLFGSERHLATSLVARVRRVGLAGRVGVASTKTAAWVAARTGEGVDVVDPGHELRRLAAVPVATLHPSPDVVRTLDRWGIKTLGDLARLPATAIGWRFGEAGIDLWRSARGEDDAPLNVRPRAWVFEESVDCEYAIDRFEPLSFLLRAAIERLVSRLEVRGLRAGNLAISLRLDGGGHEQLDVEVAAPTNDVKSLLALVRLRFEGRSLGAAIEWFRLKATPERPRTAELDLFVRVGPAPQDLDLALARLAALTGPDGVGTPTVVDSHRPDAFAVERFNPRPMHTKGTSEAGGSAIALALRAFRPAAALEVACDRGRPDFVRRTPDARKTASFGGRVVTLAGPWRLSCEWWRDSSFARDYYDAELSDGCVYRIYRDQRSGEWFADGVYD
jgi:protein ImuB